MLISFIIPVFNCEKYIRNCLNSVLSQRLNLEEFEVIIINDGSTDNTEAIIKEYIKIHKNFRYFYISHQGVSTARNHGIKIAKGKYLYFMDADDKLLESGLRILIDNYVRPFKYPDLISFNSRTVDKFYKPKDWDIIKSHRITFHGSFEEKASKKGIGFSIWNNLISRELIIEKALFFNNYSIAEDLLFMLRLFNCKEKRIVTTDLNIYRYFVHDNSSLNTNNRIHSQKLFKDLINVVENIENLKSNSSLPLYILENDILICKRWGFTRLCSGGFKYKEIKYLYSLAKKNNFFLFNNKKIIYQLMNLIAKSPLMIYIFSFFYKILIINLIKPYIKRN